MTNTELSAVIFDLFDDGTALLKERLGRVQIPIKYELDEQEESTFVILAVTLLTFACYSAAETMRILVRAGVTLQIPTLVRQQFEAAISATYICLVSPKKARDFILLDDFERLDLAREADLSPLRKQGLETECRETLKQYPELIKRLKYGPEIIAGTMPLDHKAMKAIRDKLDFPDVRSMMRELEKQHAGFTGGLYTIAFRFGSLTAHPNIVSLRRIFGHWDRATPTGPSLDLREPAAPDFTLQGLNYVVGLGMILDNILGASDEERQQWTTVRERQDVLTAKLKQTDARMKSPGDGLI